MNNINCCEIIKMVIDSFWEERNMFSDTCARKGIISYWEKYGLDKKLCDNCRKLWEKEKTRLKNDEEEEIRSDEIAAEPWK